MKSLKIILLSLLLTMVFTSENELTQTGTTADGSKLVSPTDPNNINLVGSGMMTPAVVFHSTHCNAIDIGCGGEGDICKIDPSKHKIYCYNFSTNSWDIIPLDEHLTDLERITGVDIGVGVNNEVWKIGGEKIGDNWGVWKLYCYCDCTCFCYRYCLRFRKHFYQNYCNPQNRKKCYWNRADLYGINIDVYPDGDAAVVKADGKVYRVDCKEFTATQLGTNINALDVTVSNHGIVYVTEKNTGKIYKYDEATQTWILVNDVPNRAKRLCSSAYDLLWYIRRSNKDVWTSAIYGFFH